MQLRRRKRDEEKERQPPKRQKQQTKMNPLPSFFGDYVWTRSQYEEICSDPQWSNRDECKLMPTNLQKPCEGVDVLTQENQADIAKQDRVEMYLTEKRDVKQCAYGPRLAEYVGYAERHNQVPVNPFTTKLFSVRERQELRRFENIGGPARNYEQKEREEKTQDIEMKDASEMRQQQIEREHRDLRMQYDRERLQQEWENEWEDQFSEFLNKDEWTPDDEKQLEQLAAIYRPENEQEEKQRQQLRAQERGWIVALQGLQNPQERQSKIQDVFQTFADQSRTLNIERKPITMEKVKDMLSVTMPRETIELIRHYGVTRQMVQDTFYDQLSTPTAFNLLKSMKAVYDSQQWNFSELWQGSLSFLWLYLATNPDLAQWMKQQGLTRQWIVSNWSIVAPTISVQNATSLLQNRPPLLERNDIHRLFYNDGRTQQVMYYNPETQRYDTWVVSSDRTLFGNALDTVINQRIVYKEFMEAIQVTADDFAQHNYVFVHKLLSFGGEPRVANTYGLSSMIRSMNLEPERFRQLFGHDQLRGLDFLLSRNQTVHAQHMFHNELSVNHDVLGILVRKRPPLGLSLDESQQWIESNEHVRTWFEPFMTKQFLLNNQHLQVQNWKILQQLYAQSDGVTNPNAQHWKLILQQAVQGAPFFQLQSMYLHLPFENVREGDIRVSMLNPAIQYIVTGRGDTQQWEYHDIVEEEKKQETFMEPEPQRRQRSSQRRSSPWMNYVRQHRGSGASMRQLSDQYLRRQNERVRVNVGQQSRVVDSLSIPSSSANSHPVGTRVAADNGDVWQVQVDRVGRHRWVRVR